VTRTEPGRTPSAQPPPSSTPPLPEAPPPLPEPPPPLPEAPPPWAPLVRALERNRPPLPRFTSPLRGPWLTSVFAVVLLAALPVVIATGLLSYIAYGPQYGQAIPGDVGILHLPWFDWPASPSWLYRLTQGVHVGLGLVLVPVVLAKLWSVVPKLYGWPPVRSPAQALERLSLLLLVGGILFEIVTGVLNIQYDYVFGFSFYAAHYVGAWVFIGAFVAHVALKLPHMVHGLRSRSLRAELRTPLAETLPEEPDDLGLVSPRPGRPTVSRRGALALVGGGSLLVAVLTAGQTIGGPLRRFAVLLPRGRDTALADGSPNDFPINKTFAVTGIDPAALGAAWRLDLTGGATLVRLDRDALAARPQYTATLPIACVEGWSTTQAWSGVRLRDLAALAGVPAPASAVVTSLENGPFGRVTLSSGQVLHPDALLALQVNGAPLSPDHGYPARVVVPALPGVHNTKWVRSIEFRSA
jgi:DMSO/TMAO reductase YedYZ molybdopterin-dependent catalytic subunit